MKLSAKVSGFRLSIFALGIAVFCLAMLLVSRLVLPSGAYLEDTITTQITITNTTTSANNADNDITSSSSEGEATSSSQSSATE